MAIAQKISLIEGLLQLQMLSNIWNVEVIKKGRKRQQRHTEEKEQVWTDTYEGRKE